MSRSANILGVIAIVGSVMMIASVFLTWVQIQIEVLEFNFKLTGWEVFFDWRDVIKLKYAIVPLLSLICGIIVLVLMTIVTFNNRGNYRKMNIILGAITMILALVIIIYSFMFMNKTWDYAIITIRLVNYLKVGFWLNMAGSFLAFVGGLVPILKKGKLPKPIVAE
ncbi:MAG: hypothetical protein E7Z62_08215 [Thermoplasmata archaeon]|nr:hypothetical protein [Thermoplasmata archaeon]